MTGDVVHWSRTQELKIKSYVGVHQYIGFKTFVWYPYFHLIQSIIMSVYILFFHTQRVFQILFKIYWVNSPIKLQRKKILTVAILTDVQSRNKKKLAVIMQIKKTPAQHHWYVFTVATTNWSCFSLIRIYAWMNLSSLTFAWKLKQHAFRTSIQTWE